MEENLRDSLFFDPKNGYDRIDTEERLAVEDSAPKPIVRGRDLIAHGIKPGPAMGKILAALYDAQLDGAFSDLDSGLKYANLQLTPGP